ncbi:transmembrane protein 39A [Achroia grisella]|uniref:transmembrane protein 39A n=1 Tax=Achroia grisella TaxID=688607 RepID=UPI0027D33B8D|nr:transmembrane protein 39A [Achroia grisella]
MSCTENESGPFVALFLPAVAGCLTILLARRWAYSQVNNTSSTAISRRRKIIKDPPVKRPMPPVTTKMSPPATKKSTGFNKKAAYSLLEEDLNGSRRATRARAMSDTIKRTDGTMPPKHIPFPYIPQDGTLLFETMTFIFTLVATGLQFLNLYRTIWWLPNSNTDQAMNFYLIDTHLVAFIVTILFRRLLLSMTLALLNYLLAPKLIPHATIATRMFVLGVVLGALAWCSYFIMLKHPLLKIFFLCYPAVIYLLLFGFQSGPFLELNNTETPLMHSCSHYPQQIRDEVEVMRQDFNLRLKKILFNSIVGAYYTSFIPCCFAQSYLYYDVYGASQQVAFVWAGLFGRYASQLLPATHCDVVHRAAQHLGCWRLQTGCTVNECGVSPWSSEVWWGRDSRVCAGGGVFVAAAPRVSAEPAVAHHTRFYTVFINPSVLLCMLLCLQLSLIVLQLCLLFSNIQWHHFLSILILLFINYYTLFKMTRDYLIAWKVYRAESMIYDKNNCIQNN